MPITGERVGLPIGRLGSWQAGRRAENTPTGNRLITAG